MNPLFLIFVAEQWISKDPRHVRIQRLPDYGASSAIKPNHLVNSSS